MFKAVDGKPLIVGGKLARHADCCCGGAPPFCRKCDGQPAATAFVTFANITQCIEDGVCESIFGGRSRLYDLGAFELNASYLLSLSSVSLGSGLPRCVYQYRERNAMVRTEYYSNNSCAGTGEDFSLHVNIDISIKETATPNVVQIETRYWLMEQKVGSAVEDFGGDLFVGSIYYDFGSGDTFPCCGLAFPPASNEMVPSCFNAPLSGGEGTASVILGSCP